MRAHFVISKTGAQGAREYCNFKGTFYKLQEKCPKRAHCNLRAHFVISKTWAQGARAYCNSLVVLINKKLVQREFLTICNNMGNTYKKNFSEHLEGTYIWLLEGRGSSPPPPP